MSAYAEFELDLTKAILDNLPSMLTSLAGEPLTLENVNRLPEATQGVYMLLEGGVPMYIGKTDASHGFRQRLQRHYYTLSARKNLDLGEVSFKAVRIMVFTTINVESTLIKHFLGDDPLRWQNSGFGSNDPGHNREGQEPSKFDITHPINIDRPLESIDAGQYTLHSLLLHLKAYLPFDFRFETDLNSQGKPAKATVGHLDQRNATVNVPQPGMSLRELFKEVFIPGLPAGWVATVFPGRMILYKDQTPYRYATDQFK
ncbi:MAG: hypothetical protein A3E01_00590 [Gammaproteobacteria bacterium RIFCSPHIGHO2_12_FULL_63_22]|nr:MAG: hypothetical protein A3E01_00590 [Gammaproteobacteria bacterium RIFCSPHIGHO2_12_FULL_63_22]